MRTVSGAVPTTLRPRRSSSSWQWRSSRRWAAASALEQRELGRVERAGAQRDDAPLDGGQARAALGQLAPDRVEQGREGFGIGGVVAALHGDTSWRRSQPDQAGIRARKKPSV
jgi:hypothetical protein